MVAFCCLVDMEEGGHVAGLLGGILQNVANEPLQVTTGNQWDSTITYLTQAFHCHQMPMT